MANIGCEDAWDQPGKSKLALLLGRWPGPVPARLTCVLERQRKFTYKELCTDGIEVIVAAHEGPVFPVHLWNTRAAGALWVVAAA